MLALRRVAQIKVSYTGMEMLEGLLTAWPHVKHPGTIIAMGWYHVYFMSCYLKSGKYWQMVGLEEYKTE